MALMPLYDSADDVPESLRDHYEATDDGRMMLAVDSKDGVALENVTGLKTALGTQKAKAEKAERALKAYKALEHEPEEISSMLEELGELKDSSNQTRSNSDRVSQLQAEVEKTRTVAQREREKQLAPIQEKLSARTEQLKQVMIDQSLTDAISTAGGSVPLLLRPLKDEVQAAENDQGVIEVQIVDGEGIPRVTGADLKPMTFAELVAEKKADAIYAGAFGANGSSGGGLQATANNGSPASLTPEVIANMSQREYERAREAGQL